MSEWWTYRPSSFLMFSARAYHRLFELHNAAWWPLPLLAVAVGAVLWLALWRQRAWAPRAAWAVSGLAWGFVAWAFHAERFAVINTAAEFYAWGFAAQGLVLLAGAATAGAAPRAGVPATADATADAAARGAAEAAAAATPAPAARAFGIVLMAAALVLMPTLAPLAGQPWPQAQVWALAPDPTVLATLALLLVAPAASRRWRWLAWPLPLLWCAVTGLTLATLGEPDAALLPIAGVLAAVVAWRTRRPRRLSA